ncbi:MAG: cypA [Subtercola sp.]|nr:cypA [Subtercola sp.]
MTEQGTTTLDELRAKYRRDYDPYSSITIAEMLADFADRRATVPVSYSARGNGTWVLTRYDDASSVLRRSNRGFVSFPNDPDGDNSQGSAAAMIPIEIDGPLHRQYRAFLDPYFAPQKVGLRAEGLRAWCNRLIDGFIEKGECEFTAEFALPFPGVTVMSIMGWPEEDLHLLSTWTNDIMHGGGKGTEDERNAVRGGAHVAFRGYMMELIARRRAEPPRDDVTSAAIAVEIDGQRLTDDQLFDLFLLMMLAGLDTVTSVLGQSMLYFAEHPEQWDYMFAAPENLEPAIEELLRWSAPPVPTRTVVHESVEVGGVTIPEGERVHFALSAINRDPEYYPEPDEVKLDRNDRPHLGFGLGPHRCVGMHLARLELKIAFTELHRRIPRFALKPGFTRHDHLGLAWGVDSAELVFPKGEKEF